MPDALVLATQRWVNRTYGSVSGYEPVAETGNTGWSTMYALTRGLQFELGITTLSDSFGPTTLSKLAALGPIDIGSNVKTNIIRILQCGLWSSGYQGGSYSNGTTPQDLNFSGVYDSRMAVGVSTLTTNMGLGSTSAITPKIFKGLLTMNAYVVVGRGSSGIREVQQWLNAKYLSRENFFILPCDGLFSRDVQKSLIFGIQYEQGLNDATANGSFGPTTQSGLKVTAAQPRSGNSDASSGKSFVRLFQAALRFNGYQSPFDGVFGSATATSTRTFQEFCKLTTSSYADFPTWASLLVSTGDTSRPTTACDSRTEITATRAATLKAQAPPITMVGRYLTNVPGGFNKKIQPNEISTLFAQGMGFWPIFQEYGNSLSHLNLPSGQEDGGQAHDAALSYSLPEQTVLYFAVDFDATSEQIASNVVPYFQGVARALRQRGGRYRAGVYGSRNVCSSVAEEVGTVYSFVSGMSTGFSGNLGFSLPLNWSFDQIANVTVGSGAGLIEIDKNVFQGRDQGVRTLSASNPNEQTLLYVERVRSEAVEYKGSHATAWSADRLTANYLRQLVYGGTTFTLAIGPVDNDFVDYVNAKTIQQSLSLSDPETGQTLSIPHLMAAAEGVLVSGVHAAQNVAVFEDMAGWGGDFASFFGDYIVGDGRQTPAYEFGVRKFGSFLFPNTSYGPGDYIEDVDGYNIGWSVKQAELSQLPKNIAAETRATYGSSGGWRTRYSDFLARRFGSSWATASAAVTDLAYTTDAVLAAARTGAAATTGLDWKTVNNGEKDALASSWITVLQRRVALEQ